MAHIAQEAIEWECWLNAEALVGECPIWSPSEDSLYWIDVYGNSLNRSPADGSPTKSWQLDTTIGSFALTAGDRRQSLIALADGLYSLDLDTGAQQLFSPPPYDTTAFRFNDGRCDPQGRFWVGNMPHPGGTTPMPIGISSYWRIDSRGVSREIEGTTIANGIAFSPDGATMYVADRPTWSIWAFDFDVDGGTIRNKRIFATVPEGMVPDGASVDTDGCYWIALFRAGLIMRFTPNGELDRQLKAPVTHPTMVSFGGSNLDTMYVTTARKFLDEEGLREEPLAGAIFRCDVGAKGLPEPTLDPELFTSTK